MGFWQWLVGRDLDAPEERISGQDTFLTFEDVFGDFPNTQAGVTVTPTSAFSLPVVYRCISLNAQTIAAMPVDCMIKRGTRREAYESPPWLTCPNVRYDWMQFIQEVQTSLEIDGNAFILVRRAKARIVDLWHLNPRMVEVEPEPGSRDRVRYKFDGGRETFSQEDILHIKAYSHPRSLRGLSPIQSCMEAVGQGIAAQQFGARFFGEGATLSGVIETPGSLEPKVAKSLKDSFTKSHGGANKSHAIGVLTGGAKWTPLSVKPEESQFLDTQKFTSAQIALLYGVPPNYATDAEGTKGYVTGVLAAKEMWLQFGLLYRIVRLERSFSSLLPDPNAYIKFNLRSFLRPDPQQQASMMVAEIQNGVRTINEWRALLDIDPIEGGDTPLRPLNMGPLPADDGAAQAALFNSGGEA